MVESVLRGWQRAFKLVEVVKGRRPLPIWNNPDEVIPPKYPIKSSILRL